MLSPEPTDDWSNHAQDYQRLFAPLTGYIGRSMVRVIERRLPANPRILDVACGPGHLAVAVGISLLEAGQGGGRVLALDRSPAMVGMVEQAVAREGLKPLVDCVAGDGELLEFEDHTFDAVFSCFGIFLFADRAAGWREAARVLRPGGYFVTSVWRGLEDNELARIQAEALQASLPARIREARPGPDWEGLLTREGLSQEVSGEAPFVDLEVRELAATLVLASPADLWRGMQGNPVTGRLLRECTPAEFARVERAVLARLEDQAGGMDAPVFLPTSCHILSARRG